MDEDVYHYYFSWFKWSFNTCSYFLFLITLYLNSPLFDFSDEPAASQDQVLERSPHQQGDGGDVGDGRGHHQPVRGPVVPTVQVTHEAGEPLHDHEDRRTDGCELQRLKDDQLDRLPRGHVCFLTPASMPWVRNPPHSFRVVPGWRIIQTTRHASLSKGELVQPSVDSDTAYAARLFYCWGNEVVILPLFMGPHKKKHARTYLKPMGSCVYIVNICKLM